MKISKHAKMRSQQRGISEAYMALLIAFGKISSAKNGAVSIRIDKHGMRLLENVLREGIQVMDKIKNKTVICTDDSDCTIITCYHNNSH